MVRANDDIGIRNDGDHVGCGRNGGGGDHGHGVDALWQWKSKLLRKETSQRIRCTRRMFECTMTCICISSAHIRRLGALGIVEKVSEEWSTSPN
jgi:hypothetical protein